MATKKKSEEKPKITVHASPEVKLVEVVCKTAYFDKKLNRNVYYKERVAMSEERATELAKKKLVFICGG